MEKIKIKIWVVAIFICIFFVFLNINLSLLKAQSSTLENDLYKIVPDAKTGMINVYIKKLNTYALYYSIPSSSKILLKYDNFQYLLESTGSIIQDFSIQDNKLVYKWGTKFVNLIETVEFVNLDQFNIGIQVTIEVRNLDSRGHFLAIGILFDTYLGENYNKPFQISNLGIIDSEQYFSKSSIPMTIFSLDNPNNPVVGLIFYPRKAGITSPDKIIIANYDELLNNFWNFSYVKGRNFSSQYKRQDAAVGYIYDESFINTNQAKSISFLLGFYPIKKSSETEEIKSEVEDEKGDKVTPEDVDSKIKELKAYLEEQIKTLNDKLEELNKKYENIAAMDSAFFSGQDLIKVAMELLTEITSLETKIQELNDEEFNQLYMDLLNRLEELIQKLNELINSA